MRNGKKHTAHESGKRVNDKKEIGKRWKQYLEENPKKDQIYIGKVK